MYVCPSSKIKFTLINNNLAISHHKIVCKVANERYCSIFSIFGVVWGNGVKGSPLEGTKKLKKMISQKKNNISDLSHQKTVPKVANERYYPLEVTKKVSKVQKVQKVLKVQKVRITVLTREFRYLEIK